MTRYQTKAYARSSPIITLGAVVGAVVIAALATPSYGTTVSDSMDSYWTGSLGSANITGPTAYNGQSAGYYTLGNLAVRTPQETSQIASIQMPSIRAGCGGIDVFSGGFSFINSEQLVATMKAVASNAVSYAFMLALKSLSPIIADQIESLQKLANDVNQRNMNS